MSLATGDLVAFLDDDAIAAPDWLAHFEACFVNPAVLGATGSVQPVWLGQNPKWFPPEFLWTVGCTFPGAEALSGGEIRNVMGCSMIFRRSIFMAIGGFSDRLGRTESGASLLSCEETEYCIRARSAFPQGCFVSVREASVEHRVPASRMTLRYFCRRTYAEGLSKAIVAALWADPGVLSTERTYVVRTLGGAVLRDGLRGAVRLDPHALARAASIGIGLCCATLGFIRGKLIMRTRRAQPGTAAGLVDPAGS
jgi:hypothetical protein